MVRAIIPLINDPIIGFSGVPTVLIPGHPNQSNSPSSSRSSSPSSSHLNNLGTAENQGSVDHPVIERRRLDDGDERRRLDEWDERDVDEGGVGVFSMHRRLQAFSVLKEILHVLGLANESLSGLGLGEVVLRLALAVLDADVAAAAVVRSSSAGLLALLAVGEAPPMLAGTETGVGAVAAGAALAEGDTVGIPVPQRPDRADPAPVVAELLVEDTRPVPVGHVRVVLEGVIALDKAIPADVLLTGNALLPVKGHTAELVGDRSGLGGLGGPRSPRRRAAANVGTQSRRST